MFHEAKNTKKNEQHGGTKQTLFGMGDVMINTQRLMDMHVLSKGKNDQNTLVYLLQ